MIDDEEDKKGVEKRNRKEDHGSLGRSSCQPVVQLKGVTTTMLMMMIKIKLIVNFGACQKQQIGERERYEMGLLPPSFPFTGKIKKEVLWRRRSMMMTKIMMMMVIILVMATISKALIVTKITIVMAMRLIFKGERRQNNYDDDEDVVDDGRTWNPSNISSREGEEVSLVCISEGARPAAVLAWYNGTRWAVE